VPVNLKKKTNVIIVLIYVVMLLFFVAKGFYYMDNVARFPDESRHVAYIATLEKTGDIIPDFKEMTALRELKDVSGQPLSHANEDRIKVYVENPNTTNYLGHPPLYYHIMRLSGGVAIQGDQILVNLFQLRVFSLAICAVGMVLTFYIGYSRIKKSIALHLFYAVTCVSVPMLVYNCAGVNNDALSFLAFPILVLGLLRFLEGTRDFKTYLLIASGIFLIFFSKLTAALVVLVMVAAMLLYLLIKERNLRFLISKQFLLTVPLYVLILAYLVVVYRQVGSIQPSLSNLNLEHYHESFFYVPPAERVSMTVAQYAAYYSKNYFETWTGIASHVSLLKGMSPFTWERIALLGLWVLPLLLLIPKKGQQKSRKNSAMRSVGLFVYAGLLAASLVQGLRAYLQFQYVSGYMGGFQTRYYLCVIAGLALACTYALQRLMEGKEQLAMEGEALTADVSRSVRIRKWVVTAFCVGYSALLLYEDFIYFILNFTAYL
jgi:hypothetical protein